MRKTIEYPVRSSIPTRELNFLRAMPPRLKSTQEQYEGTGDIREGEWHRVELREGRVFALSKVGDGKPVGLAAETLP